jgi:hypothetical protein
MLLWGMGKAMDRFNDSGRRPRPSSGRRRVMRAVVGILLIAAGVSLRFLITASPPGLKLHDVGVVLILAGVLALLLVPASARGDWLRTRWVSPGLPEPYRGPGAVRHRLDYDYDDGPVAAGELPALDFDPPPEAASGEASQR